MSQDSAKVIQSVSRSPRHFAHPIRCPILHYPDEYGLEYEDVFFPSLDGTPLEGWFLPCKSSSLLVICNHVLWMNRQGIGAAGGNDFEVNFMPDYKHLHDAGYNVLCYDLRNHGHSGTANGGITGNGYYESRDVAASINWHCSAGAIGANSTIVAAAKYPEYFTEIKCMVAPQPISMGAIYKAVTKLLGMPEKLQEIDRDTQLINGFTADKMSPIPYAKAVTWPTLLLQIFNRLGTKEKELHWIHGTTRRFDGYKYLPEHPEVLLGWLDKYMK
ncbi:hypothetical protein DL89DRAFT_278591 [Linderina pennispora]|uniref:Alpha/beta-hydrolase n=1 Tax=Linderina pennispora TaxID=61395 RepID=A0A1Y1W5C2_9FUNG|nr:uncharacterized protein DL89DRAFT_278591 [Linderina pennispora]ORX68727.1 hypothetical protein DL89DRAFT_278591 [Linderina pennispora]